MNLITLVVVVIQLSCFLTLNRADQIVTLTKQDVITLGNKFRDIILDQKLDSNGRCSSYIVESKKYFKNKVDSDLSNPILLTSVFQAFKEQNIFWINKKMLDDLNGCINLASVTVAPASEENNSVKDGNEVEAIKENNIIGNDGAQNVIKPAESDSSETDINSSKLDIQTEHEDNNQISAIDNNLDIVDAESNDNIDNANNDNNQKDIFPDKDSDGVELDSENKIFTLLEQQKDELAMIKLKLDELNERFDDLSISLVNNKNKKNFINKAIEQIIDEKNHIPRLVCKLQCHRCNKNSDSFACYKCKACRNK